jgi:putative flippase GtrA
MILRTVCAHIPPRLREFLSFTAVGGLNACFGYGVFCLAVFLGFSPVVALLIANILGVSFNFMTYGKLVFRRLSWRRLHWFVGLYVINYFGNAALLVKLHGIVRSPYLAQLMILPLSVLFLYFSFRRFVFPSSA